jgi:prefoldin subunit 5
MDPIKEKMKEIQKIEDEISILEGKIEKIKQEINEIRENDPKVPKQLKIQFNYD